jgi:photosystem II stability/assembly factor-like uncharacterized protein
VSCGLAVSLLALALAAPVRAAAAGDAAQTNGYDPALFAGLRYRMVGPSRGGRVTAVAGHRARRSTFFMGASGGGVWKTTDYGHSWHNVSDGYFATGSIGAIRVADSDPDVVWVGTGSDGLRSNVIIGKGVYRSDDGGTTWRHVGLEAVGNIGALLVHPEDPDRVWVAAIGNPFAPNPERGVFRTADGGETWERVLFVSERTGAVDLEVAPDDPTLIYATLWRAERKPWTIISGGREGGVYRSRDGGETWAPLTGGLPEGLRGKADLAVSGADPDRVYVLIEAPGDKGGVYRSDDRGDTWRQVTDFQPIRNRPFYYTNLEAHPKDPDVLWGMAEGHWKSEDGGVTWKRQSVPHGDNHDMWINPDDPEILIQSNDGGANVSLDGGKSWSTQHNQPTAELYQVDVSDEVPYRLYAGQQDNSTISVPSRPPRLMPGGSEALWEAVGGCETGPAVPKPGDPDVVYANCKGRFGVYNRRTGQEQQFYVGFWNLYGHNPRELAYRFQRVAPIHVSPHDPDRVYHGSQFVHVTRDGGRTWRVISPDLTAFTEETQVVSGTPITIDVTGEEHFSALYDIQDLGRRQRRADPRDSRRRRDVGGSDARGPRPLRASPAARGLAPRDREGLRLRAALSARRLPAPRLSDERLRGVLDADHYRVERHPRRPSRARGARGSVPSRSPLRRNRVRDVRLLRRRRALAVLPAEPARHPRHRHQAGRRGSSSLDDGTGLLDPLRPEPASRADGRDRGL